MGLMAGEVDDVRTTENRKGVGKSLEGLSRGNLCEPQQLGRTRTDALSYILARRSFRRQNCGRLTTNNATSTFAWPSVVAALNSTVPSAPCSE